MLTLDKQNYFRQCDLSIIVEMFAMRGFIILYYSIPNCLIIRLYPIYRVMKKKLYHCNCSFQRRFQGGGAAPLATY